MKRIVNEQLAITNTNPIKARFYDYRYFTYPWHFHSEFELIYIERGHGQCLVGDSCITYSDQTLILFGPELPHCMQSHPEYREDETLRVNGAIIQFEKDFMQYSFSHYTQFVQINHLLQDARRGIRFCIGKAPDIQHMLKQIPASGGVEQITLILSLLQSLAEFRQKQFAASPNYRSVPPEFKDTKIEKVVSYLSKRYTRPITLEEIASYTAMNPAAFCRFFKAGTGKTFKQYVLDMRIGYACRLLAAGTRTVSQICAECGFESTPYFNRSFKKITGLTPSEYKEKLA